MSSRLEKKPAEYAYATIKASKRKNLLTKEDFCRWFDNSPRECIYCGLREEESKKIFNRRMTIDRKINTIGYTLENIVFACDLCNRSKGDFFTYEEWKEIAQEYNIAERIRNRIKS